MGYADIKEISIADAKRQILGWCEELKLPVAFWGEGSLPMMVVEVGARIWNRSSITASALKTLFVGQDASNDILDVWSRSVYNHNRYPSSPAVHQCTLTCAAGSGPYTITEGSVVATDGSYQLSNTTGHLDVEYPVTLPAGGTLALPFVVDKPGSAGSNITPGTINRLVTTMAGVTISNPELTGSPGSSLLVAGADKESDAQLKERNATIWATRNILALPRDGYIYWARTVPEVRRVGVIDNNPRGEFTVDVVLAGDTSGVGLDAVVDVEAVLRTKVLSSFFGGVSVYSATERAFTPVGKVFLRPGTDPVQAEVAIRKALVGNPDDAADPVNDTNLSRNLPVGGQTFDGTNHQVLRAAFENAIRSATIGDQECVQYVALTSPAEYTTIEAWEVPTVMVTFDDAHLKLIVLTE